jgi:hypothetical protein
MLLVFSYMCSCVYKISIVIVLCALLVFLQRRSVCMLSIMTVCMNVRNSLPVLVSRHIDLFDRLAYANMYLLMDMSLCNYHGKYKCVCVRTVVYLYTFMYTYPRHVIRTRHIILNKQIHLHTPSSIPKKTSGIEHIINTKT